MKLFVSPDLLRHRRGRFLASILDVEEWVEDKPPESGVVLVSGEALQQSAEKRASYLAWARLPGRCLLLIPPFHLGSLIDELDWWISYASSSKHSLETKSIAKLVASEVQYQLGGRDGGSESSADHYWDDHTFHTRYWQAYSNSGMIGITVLPLWSISLMDHAELLVSFLSWFSDQCGNASPKVAIDNEEKQTLEPKDHTVLVGCFGLGVSSAAELSTKIIQSEVPFFDLSGFDLLASFERLSRLGFVDHQGVTEAGLSYLQESPYWGFAEHLRRLSY